MSQALEHCTTKELTLNRLKSITQHKKNFFPSIIPNFFPKTATTCEQQQTKERRKSNEWKKLRESPIKNESRHKVYASSLAAKIGNEWETAT